MSNLMFIGELITDAIYVKPTNDVGGWSYAANPGAEDSKFYEFNGEWFYIVKDHIELESLRDQGTWLTSTDPNQLVSITDKDSIAKSIPMNNLVTTRVDDMGSMFRGSFPYNMISFNQYIENWDVSNVEHMGNMFHGSVAFNQPIENWDTGNVWSMVNIFGDSLFNQPIGKWAVHNVARMDGMFRDNVVFNQDLSSWCVSSVTNHTNFDTGATAWTLPKPNFSNPPC